MGRSQLRVCLVGEMGVLDPIGVYLGTDFLKVPRSSALVLPRAKRAVAEWVAPSGPVERGCRAEPHLVYVTCNPNQD